MSFQCPTGTGSLDFSFVDMLLEDDPPAFALAVEPARPASDSHLPAPPVHAQAQAQAQHTTDVSSSSNVVRGWSRYFEEFDRHNQVAGRCKQMPLSLRGPLRLRLERNQRLGKAITDLLRQPVFDLECQILLERCMDQYHQATVSLEALLKLGDVAGLTHILIRWQQLAQDSIAVLRPAQPSRRIRELEEQFCNLLCQFDRASTLAACQHELHRLTDCLMQAQRPLHGDAHSSAHRLRTASLRPSASPVLSERAHAIAANPLPPATTSMPPPRWIPPRSRPRPTPTAGTAAVPPAFVGPAASLPNIADTGRPASRSALPLPVLDLLDPDLSAQWSFEWSIP